MYIRVMVSEDGRQMALAQVSIRQPSLVLMVLKLSIISYGDTDSSLLPWHTI
jgi:hypothetical protein